MLKKTSELEKQKDWENRWDKVVAGHCDPPYTVYRCKLCNQSYGKRISHYPCYDDEIDKRGGEVGMTISLEEFNGLNGSPAGGFAANPNSLKNKILRTLSETEAYSAEELAQMEELKGEDVQKIKNTAGQLCKQKGDKPAKVARKWDENHVAYFVKLPDAS